MTAAYGQTKEAAGGTGTSKSTGAFGSSVTAGSAIAWFIGYGHGSSAQTVSIARSGDADIIEIANFYEGVTSHRGGRMGYIRGASAGTSQLTATFSASVDEMFIAAIEITGSNVQCASGEGAGQYHVAPSSGADAFTSGNATPGAQPGLCLSLAIEFSVGAANLSNGTGFTNRYTGGNYGFGNQVKIEDLTFSSTSALGGLWTVPGGSYGMAMMMLFREIAAGGVSRSKSMTGGMRDMAGGMNG